MVRFRNNGQRAVTLQSFGANCSCFSCSDLPKIESGATATIAVRLQACDVVGEVHRQIWFSSDDPAQAEIRLGVRYHVIAGAIVDPSPLNFGLIWERDATRLLTVESRNGKPLQIVGVSCENNNISCTVTKAASARGDPGQVLVQIPLPLPEGAIRTTVLIHTDSPDAPMIQIPVTAEVIDGVHAIEPAIELGAIEPGQLPKRSCRLRCESFARVTEVRSLNDEVEICSVEQAGEWVSVTFQVRHTSELGEFNRSLWMEIENGRRWHVRWPIHGRVVEPARKDRALGAWD